VLSKPEQHIAKELEKNLETYQDIIGNLEKGQAYGFANMAENYDALLVANEVYSDQDGHVLSTAATIYGLDKDGNIMEYGTVESTSTAYPLSTVDGALIFGSHHHVATNILRDGALLTKEDALEKFDSDGKATYYYFSLEEEFEGQVEDDKQFASLNAKYEDAIPVNFTVVE